MCSQKQERKKYRPTDSGEGGWGRKKLVIGEKGALQIKSWGFENVFFYINYWINEY